MARNRFGPAILSAAAIVVIWACGGDSSGSNFTIGGSVSGLSGTLVLQNNGADDLALTADGSFTFANTVANGAASSALIEFEPEAYLKAPNAETSDAAGWAVAIDGDTIVVGAPFEDSSQTSITNGTTASSDNSASSAGAAYVFARSGSTWSQQAYLKAPNAGAGDRFGVSVAISGDTIVVGARDEDSSQTSITNGTTASSDNSASGSGATYVFNRSGTTWSHKAYLKAPNGEAGDSFGQSVAIDGDTIVVGAYLAGCGKTPKIHRKDPIWSFREISNSNHNNGLAIQLDVGRVKIDPPN